jgi:hypothetical protein
MPIHTAPFFRNRELALEAAGLIVKLNSDGYNETVSAENAGLKAKNIVPALIYNYNGTQRAATE